jgi:hypothetical protein
MLTALTRGSDIAKTGQVDHHVLANYLSDELGDERRWRPFLLACRRRIKADVLKELDKSIFNFISSFYVASETL